MSENPTTPVRPQWLSTYEGPDPLIEHYMRPLQVGARWASVMHFPTDEQFTIYLWPGKTQFAPTREEARKIAEDWVNRDPALQ